MQFPSSRATPDTSDSRGLVVPRLIGFVPNDSRRGTRLSKFSVVARDGVTDAGVLVNTVELMLRQQLRAPDTSEAQREDARLMLRIIDQHPVEATEYAEHIIHRQRLSEAERQRLKDERREGHRHAWSESQFPTEKQCALLRQLGVHGIPESRAAASRLIDAVLRERREGRR